MLIILNHLDQHLLAVLDQVVGLLPVKVEVAEPGALEVAELAVEGFELVVDTGDVCLQSDGAVKGPVTLIALERLLRVPDGDVTLEVHPGTEGHVALPAAEDLARVVPQNVHPQLTAVLIDLATLSAQMTGVRDRVNQLMVYLQVLLSLEEAVAELTRESIDVRAVHLDHVVLQSPVAGEVGATLRADQGLDVMPRRDLLELRLFRVLLVEALQVTCQERGTAVVENLFAVRTSDQVLW